MAEQRPREPGSGAGIGVGAFVETFEVENTGNGPLDGLSFAVKDLIDVGGRTTGCGNPTWRDTHPPAAANAVCVEQLLEAGARCVGKTVTDELAFSLLGENPHYGTPLNPLAPDRVPGGSSSGSASAVAQGHVDFALGTDTGGSIRVPASNCGVWGMRPSHGLVSVAGVNPFAPTFDTVGVLAGSAEILDRVSSVLLAKDGSTDDAPGTVHLLEEAFSVAEPCVRRALEEPVERLREIFGWRVRNTPTREIDGEKATSGREDTTGFEAWLNTYGVVQWTEIWSSLGAWVQEANPEFGPEAAQNFELVRRLDRRRAASAVRRREYLSRRLETFLGPNDLMCMPTTPALAPRKGSVGARGSATAGEYYPRALSLTSVAGIGRLPQASLPLVASRGIPVGLSLLAAKGQDAFLLGTVRKFAAAWAPSAE